MLTVMGYVIFAESILIALGIWMIQDPESWAAAEKRIRRWERRAWHRFIRAFKRVCRKILRMEGTKNVESI